MSDRNAFIFQAAKDARASQDTLIDVFEQIEMFFRRLEIYTEVPLTTEMMDIIIQIMVEVLSILGIATKETKEGRMSKYLLYISYTIMLTRRRSGKYMKKLMGRTEIEDALKKLDKLTQEEARMAAAQNLKATHTVDERVKGVADAVVTMDNKVAGVDNRVAGVGDQVAGVSDRVASVSGQVAGVDDRVQQMADEVKRLSSTLISADCGLITIILENQLRESIHKWLSPPDPSTNHNIACGTHHKKTATWFFEGSIFQDWKSTGSLLWIHGKRSPCSFSNLTPSDSILYCSWLRQKCYLVRAF